MELPKLLESREMATTTLKDSFSTTVSEFFVNQVASQLSEWLKSNKDLDVSPEEICSAFDIAYTPRATMAGLPQSANMPTQMPNLPGYFAGTGASPAPGGKGSGRGGGRKKAPVDPNAPKCTYTFQRGNKKGENCDEPVAGSGVPGGDKYCKNCLKKKTVQNRVASGSSDRSTVQPPTVPNGMVSVPDQEPADGGDNTINVVPIPGSDLYKEVNNNFILRQDPDGTVVALSVEENGIQRDLTADEKKTAQILGLSFVDSPTQSQAPAQNVPTIPSVPSAEPSSNVPVVPQVPSAVPVDAAVPAQ